MLYWVVEASPLKVTSVVSEVLSFRKLTLKPAMGLKPVNAGFSHWMRRLSVVRSTTTRPVGGPGGTGEDGRRGMEEKRMGKKDKKESSNLSYVITHFTTCHLISSSHCTLTHAISAPEPHSINSNTGTDSISCHSFLHLYMRHFRHVSFTLIHMHT